ncbi:LRP2 protein, partial [Polypterus senegalus]
MNKEGLVYDLTDIWNNQTFTEQTTIFPLNSHMVSYSALRLYWVDAFFDKIEHSTFGGADRRTLPRINQMSHPFGMTIFGAYAYVTDWRLGGIIRVRKTDGGDATIIRRGISRIMHVKSYNANYQSGTNYCNRPANPNGDCSHFCFPVPNFQRICGCPYGMKLSTNQQTCVDDPDNQPPIPQCGENSFPCSNGKCVPQHFRCDGVDDCHDNSDEANCGVQNNTCSPSAFTCTTRQCIPRSWQCDGQNDCSDGSDEQNCPTHEPATCTPSQFTCANRRCIPIVWLCDTDNDCDDGSDELNCNFTSTCYPGQFQCPDHRCIDPSYACDGDRDCADGADEQGCTYNCTATEFKCANGHQCISTFYRCDGVFDCNDQSDESGCPTRMPGMCHHNSEFQCQSDGSCIPSSWECDQHPDCDDGSDEHQGCPVRTCHSSMFHCDNGNCIYSRWVCDGDNDCRDMSDEKDCPALPFSCLSGQWQCPGQSICINLTKVCDNVPDCPNGADESPLCNQESCADNSTGCTHGCIQGPFGAQCTCPTGYRLTNDSRTCEDIDECQPPGICSQHCFNERGSFRCHCEDGYALEGDQRTCKVTGTRDTLLLVASRSQIVSDNITSQPNVIGFLVRDGRNIVAIDFDSVTDRIYWSDTTQDKIWSAYKNGTERTVVFDSGVTVTESIAVDWVGRNLYWTDFVLETIEVSKLDGSHRTVLISENVTNPRGLILDPRNDAHVMFWTDWGRNPRIERASMDGNMRTTIVSNKLYWPNGLTIDYPNRLLYFADAYLDFIDYCDYNGNNRRQVLASDLVLQHPHAITIFEDYVYWTDRYTHRVIRANKWHGENQTVMIYNLPQPMGIVAVHSARQPPVEDPFLIVVRDSIIYGISLNPQDKSNDAMVPIVGLQNGYDVDFDDVEQMIYWVENPGEIHRVKSDGTNRTEFAPAAILGTPVGLALDWMTRNLYYTNPATQSIEVLKLTGDVKYRKTVITNNGQPTGAGTPLGIALDPARGRMYWTDHGTESGVPAKVAAADMDGSNAQILFTTNLDHVEFITIDIRENKLYWSVTASGVIERGDPDGTNRITVVNGLSHPWGIALYDTFLYFSDRDYEVIERVDKATGANRVVMRDNVAGLRVLKVHYRDESAGSSNGCSNNLGICQQLCLPRPNGLFTCACATGFKLNADNRTCSPYNSYVVISMLSALKGFSLEGSDHSEAMVPVAGRGRNALHVDVHMQSGFIYWCDFSSSVASQNGIRRIKPDGSSFRNIVTSGIGQNGIRGIAVDWVAGNLYFTNAFLTETYIEVVRLNTSYRRILLKTMVDMPRHIAVDPKNRYLFWADYGQNPKIERSFLDGTNRTVLVSSGILTPRGVAVDHQNGFVYWVDDSLDMIARIRPEGGETEIIRYGSRYPTPYGITIFQNTMVWVDRNLKKVFQASKEPGNTEQPSVIRDNINYLRDVTVFDSRAQSTSPQDINNNPCLVRNGGCSHFCFAIPNTPTRKCLCGFGNLAADGSSCIVSRDDYLIYTTEASVRSLRLDPEDHNLPFPVVNVQRTAVALDYDRDDNRLYFTQSMGVGRSRISFLTLSSPTSAATVIASDLGSPDGIAYDWINKRIYYSDYMNQTISSMAIDGTQRTIIARVPRPRAIMLDPCRGYMYWTDWGTNAKIERATLGGNFRTEIVNTSLVWPNGLTLDIEEERLYWADANLQKIERCSLTGSNREVIVSTAIYPFAMTIYDEHIYWTDWSRRSIYRANKHDGSDQIIMVQNIPHRPMDIHVLSASKQNQCTNPCDQFNGGCSHICAPGPHGAECQCPTEGRWYLADNKHCIHDNGTRCQPDQFTCMNGRCIRAQWKCDTDNDCGDGSDELERVCAFHTCDPTLFTCGNGRCVPYHYRCDYYNDCGDNSDEAGCLFRPCDANTEFTCNNGRCIAKEYVCNGINNCYDNGTTDERNCRRCDRRNDCGDGSDERGCTYLPCSQQQFTCQNGRCISRSFVCDGDNDCGDESDEQEHLCHTPAATCPPYQFRCDNGNCIQNSKVCDRSDDCGDNSDEKGCGINECTDPSMHHCDHNCTDTPTSFRCMCRPGYRLMSDNRTCDDVDECNESPSVCSQLCENTVGSYICKCAPGYIREPDGRRCRQNSNIAPYLIFSNRYYLRNLSTDGSSYSLILQGLTSVVAMDFDRVDKRLYWIDVTRGVIERMFLNGTNKETIISGIRHGEGLAVDWVGRKLYWVDTYLDCLNVAELDGRFVKKLAQHCIDPNNTYCFENPRGVVVHPKYGFVFWTDWGYKAFIGRVGMDGTNKTVIISTKIEWPNGVTIDYTNDKLYWADAHLNYIDHKRQVINGKILSAVSLMLQELTNPCGLNNGGCSHLCLIKNGGQGYTCECPDNFVTIQLGGVARCLAMCSSTQYRCADNERCIPIWWKCDGQQDCRDGSDEPPTCPHRYCRIGQFQCNDGNCTSPHVLCNTVQDCHDGSDEDTILCANHQCETHQWQCNNKKCIPEAWQCDGENDCGDNSDEDSAHCASRTCQPGQFKCNNGRCIPQTWKCDVDDDCGDNSDEPHDECMGPAYRCDSHTEFDCRTNYRCVPLWSVCNGYDDCRDNSDEQGCEELTCDPVGDFRCDNHRCIPLRWKCDGDNDCGDGSDERSCVPRECTESEYRCDNLHCIPGRWVCDHDNDCEDNSDERDCVDVPCDPPYRFRCSNNRCVYSHELCNGVDDCGDGSDEKEEHCKAPTQGPCTTEEFKCTNTHCVLLQYVCDNYDDCGDHSDELGCNLGTGRSCHENICEQNCTNLSEGGFLCSCRPGYSPSETDRNSCDDINECEIYGTCPQDCKNSKGSYECFCSEGFRSVGEQHGIECAATGNPPVMLLPDSVRIRRYNLSSEQYSDYVDDEDHIRALDYDWDPEGDGLSIVYWTVGGRGSQFGVIKRAYMTTFDDRGSNPVKKVDLNLRYISNPNGIAVDWVGRTMYWTDWGRQPKIESAWMDGRNRLVLVDDDIGWPTGLTIDYLNGDRLYWSDAKDNMIESMKSDGSDRKIIISGDIGNPYSLDVFEGHVYWTTKESGEVWKKNKFGNGEKVKVLTINPWLTQVRIYQEHRYNRTVPNICKDVCSHLCLLRPGGYTCACPQGSQFVTGSQTQCDAAIEDPVTMPLACRCMNGGTCYTDEGGLPKCKCLYGYSGDYCQVGKLRGAPAGTAVAVFLAVILILIFGALAVGGFLNYRRTGKLLPSLPKLPRQVLSSLAKSSENTNGVTFRTGDDVTMDLGPPELNGDSSIDKAMQLDDKFAVGTSKEPVTYDNPLYSVAIGDPAIIHATQVTVNVTTDRTENIKASDSPTAADAGKSPSEETSQMEKEQAKKNQDEDEPSPFAPPAKSQKKERLAEFTPTEDTFIDTANLVKEDSDV